MNGVRLLFKKENLQLGLIRRAARATSGLEHGQRESMPPAAGIPGVVVNVIANDGWVSGRLFGLIAIGPRGCRRFVECMA